MFMALPLGDSVSWFPRLFLSGALSIALLPAVQHPADVTPYAVLSNLLVGFLLGAPLKLVVDVAEMCGELLDVARGQTVAAVNDPLNNPTSSDLATVARIGVTVLAIQWGGIDFCLETLGASIHAVDLNGPRLTDNSLHDVVQGWFGVVAAGLQLCLVWFVAYVLCDILMALMARASHNMQFTLPASILKMVVTYGLLIILMQSSRIPSSLELRQLLRRVTPEFIVRTYE
jgi:flagellar biosynthesis protein FliR